MIGPDVQFIPVNGIRIAYRYQPPSDGRRVFVWFCGFKSEMDSIKATALAEWCATSGAGCLRFDYSGHGQSDGAFEKATVSAWLGEAEAVVELIDGSNDVVFVGSSMGGWIALLLARKLAETGQRRPEALALIAPAWDFTRLMWERAPEEARAALLETGVYHRPSTYSETPHPITMTLIEDGNARLFGSGPVTVGSPIRIVHGMRDPDVPYQHSLSLLDVITDTDVRLTLIKDGEHRLSRPKDLAVLFSILSEFDTAS